jgi:flagellar FliL protein
MSDEHEGEAKEAAHPAPAGPKPPKIVLALLALNLGLSGFAAFKAATAKPAHASAEKHEAKEAESSAGNGEVTGTVVGLDPFVVNLNETGTSRYLKVSIQLELSEHEAEKQIEKSKQVIRDDMLSYLSGLRLKDTLGAQAKDKIRTDLLAKIEDVIGTHKVRRMFFQEFVVQ